MPSSWHEKKARLAAAQFERELAALGDNESKVKNQATDAAMGGGEEAFYEKKLSKEEKKELAAKKREEKRKAKLRAAGLDDGDGNDDDGGGGGGEDDEMRRAAKVLESVISQKNGDANDDDVSSRRDNNPLAEQLASEGTICTFAASRKGVDARSRDVNVQNLTLQHRGNVMLDGTAIVLNHGNRYGLIGRNGCGKSTLMKALGARAVPIPAGIDAFHLKEEVEPSDTMTALDAVMSVDEERARLEREAEDLNAAISALTDAAERNANGGGGEDDDGGTGGDGLTLDEKQEMLMDMLTSTYERLDDLDADTAETRARSILQGLGFTHDMQSKFTKVRVLMKRGGLSCV